MRKIRDESLRRRIGEAIEQVEAARTLREVPNLTKMSGSSGFYRIRVGDYRIGLAVEGDEVEFVRVCAAEIFTGIFRRVQRLFIASALFGKFATGSTPRL